MKKILILFFFSSVGFIGLNFGFDQNKSTLQIEQPAMEDVVVENWQEPKLSLLDSVFNYICKSTIVHKDIVIKQAIWETGWLKSSFLMSKNNLFGFRAKEYLSFPSWQASVDYYEKWQNKYYTNRDEDYYAFLVRIRYSNSRYPAHLKSLSFNKKCEND
jgi:hypothetical protein